jgi:hypothetical protein
VTFEQYRDADKEYRRLAKQSAKASEARSALPAGSSRARVTTANARWMRAAEARDRREMELRETFADYLDTARDLAEQDQIDRMRDERMERAS